MSAPLSIEEQIEQLNKARDLVQADPAHYPQIVHGILPFATRPEVQLRRWCSGFLCDAFMSSGIDQSTKKSLAVTCLSSLLNLLGDTDTWVLRNTITCSSFVYPLIFAVVASDGSQVEIWNNLLQLKSKVLSHWESSHTGIRASCNKFASRLVAVQSHGSKDPRVAQPSDISLSNVPQGHPLISLSLEAEAQAYLDRILFIFSEEKVSSSLITAIVYSLSSLLRTRPTTATKIINTILNFDLTKKMISSSDTMETKLEYRFIAKCLKIFFANVLKNNFSPKLNPRIQKHIQYLSNLPRSINEAKKRSANSEEPENLKRQKVDEQRQTLTPTPALPFNMTTDVAPTGPISYASLYTLINSSDGLASFDAKILPHNIAINIALAGLAAANDDTFNQCMGVVRKRYSNLRNRENSNRIGGGNDNESLLSTPYTAQNSISKSSNPIPDSFNNYKPAPQIGSPMTATGRAYEAVDSSNSTALKADFVNEPRAEYIGAVVDSEEEAGNKVSLRNVENATPIFSLSAPEKLSNPVKISAFDSIIDRIISYSTLDPSEESSVSIVGASDQTPLNKAVIEEWTKNSWLSFLNRALTRGIILGPNETMNSDTSAINTSNSVFADRIREKLFAYCTDSFRERLDVITGWLNEEWYSEFVLQQKSDKTVENSHYFKWATKVLDNIIPFVDNNDWKVFIRLLSDLPELNAALISRLKSLCIDPDRSQTGIRALKFLIMLRPPVKESCLEIVEDIYKSHEDMKASTEPLLKRYRPSVVNN
ncbi:hypothetical protein NADFUDRAFT_51544 [Nadsonia fulvescens var. elongata DSM 6958]|uniref:Symplekin/Pta1 N-terminal domain-containing protein n=1 Tax=Nadsonia fulvescens var. elongata DSM 6958 TaxID=857566 RepID=A0A1E3PHQ2_9ASCO|nr:hypothetical protein NADFUDRAFT_51544 [Nadsonia fulvescens var. elongata DSM 6958]